MPKRARVDRERVLFIDDMVTGNYFPHFFRRQEPVDVSLHGLPHILKDFAVKHANWRLYSMIKFVCDTQLGTTRL
jgi:hypothetical protein